MKIKLITCFSCVIRTIYFQRLNILLVTLLFFIVDYIFLKQFIKLLMVKYTYLLTCIILRFMPKHCVFWSQKQKMATRELVSVSWLLMLLFSYSGCKVPNRSTRFHSGVFIDFEYIWYIALVFFLLTLNM